MRFGRELALVLVLVLRLLPSTSFSTFLVLLLPLLLRLLPPSAAASSSLSTFLLLPWTGLRYEPWLGRKLSPALARSARSWKAGGPVSVSRATTASQGADV